jgi:serine/threonine protein kinase
MASSSAVDARRKVLSEQAIQGDRPASTKKVRSVAALAPRVTPKTKSAARRMRCRARVPSRLWRKAESAGWSGSRERRPHPARLGYPAATMLATLVGGTIFARDYRVVGLLAEGGFGAVYRVEQITNGRSRALKILHPYVVGSPKMRERFEQEARIGAMIESEHVVEVSAAGIDEATGTPWLAMELLDGEDLAKVMRSRGRLGAEEMLSILEDACDALGAAHRKGILHLDLKPENLFVAKKKLRGVSQVVKVLDFGISRIVAENRMSVTVTTGIGSNLWMSPEQAMKGARVVPASDVWALGLIAFHLLTGGYYWDAANVEPGEDISGAAVFAEMLTSALPPPSERAAVLGVAGALPAGFDGWFARCVARSADARYRNASAAIEGLREVLSGEATSVPPGPRHSPTAVVTETPVAPVLLTRASRTEVMDRAPVERTPRPVLAGSPDRVDGYVGLVLAAVVVGAMVAVTATGMVRGRQGMARGVGYLALLLLVLVGPNASILSRVVSMRRTHGVYLAVVVGAFALGAVPILALDWPR